MSPRQRSNVSENNDLFMLLCGMYQLFTASAHAAETGVNAPAQRAQTRSETKSPTPLDGPPNLRLLT